MIDTPQPAETERLVTFAQATGFFNAEEVEIVREMLADFFAHPESDEYIWQMYRDARGAPPLGFVCYGPASASDGAWDLYWIAVDPEHQSKKIGTALINYVEDDLQKRGARQLYIETSDTPQYAPTRAFYEKRGYERAAHFPDYYHIGDGKVIYRKVFPSR
jgi:ribosomal protein S18 acetylase RimI-like enzyme